MKTAATRSLFFLGMAIAFLAVALAGFSTTFFIPLARGTFSAPSVVHVHGALLFAWLRFRHFLPMVPDPFVTFSLVADSLLLVAIARDWIVLRRVHPAYVWAGGAMVAVHLVELSALTSEPWLRLSRWLLGIDAATA